MTQISVTATRKRAAKIAAKALRMLLIGAGLAAQLIWLGLLGFGAVKLAMLI